MLYLMKIFMPSFSELLRIDRTLSKALSGFSINLSYNSQVTTNLGIIYSIILSLWKGRGVLKFVHPL